jgi:hypothetical protein
MKKLMIASFGLLTSTALLMESCSNPHAGTSISSSTDHGHEHSFACPMHPEVTGKEGDNCPKCGMKLEHADVAVDNSKEYFMQFSTNKARVNPDEDLMLSFVPRVKGAEQDPVGLDIEHEKKIHLIIVSEDLSYFDHIHPEYTADGSYQVMTTFPHGGSYKVFADYKPTGGNHMVDKFDLKVEGNAGSSKTYHQDELVADAGDGFKVMLNPVGGKFLSDVPMHMVGEIKLNGKEVDPSTLENYLGAKAHMVVISLNDKEYLHVHPGVQGGKFDLHTSFENPGIYKGWIQFQSNGKVYTSSFVMNVQKGTSKGIVNRVSMDASVHQGHSH